MSCSTAAWIRSAANAARTLEYAYDDWCIAQTAKMLGKDEVSPEDMMALQFEVGQYNAMLESLSSVTKSMTDMMKSLAQRTG